MMKSRYHYTFGNGSSPLYAIITDASVAAHGTITNHASLFVQASVIAPYSKLNCFRV